MTLEELQCWEKMNINAEEENIWFYLLLLKLSDWPNAM